MWVGKEGPLIHVACCCANLFIKLFPSINTNEGRPIDSSPIKCFAYQYSSKTGGYLCSRSFRCLCCLWVTNWWCIVQS